MKLSTLNLGLADSVMKTGSFVQTLEKRQGWIDDEALTALAQPWQKNGYGAYLKNLLKYNVI